jgi:hypothetical protein
MTVMARGLPCVDSKVLSSSQRLPNVYTSHGSESYIWPLSLKRLSLFQCLPKCVLAAGTALALQPVFLMLKVQFHLVCL